MIKRLHPGYLHIYGNEGAMNSKAVMRSIELLGKEVIPALQRDSAARALRLVQRQHRFVGSVGDGLSSLSHRERVGGEGLCAWAPCPGAPHPNPLPEGRGHVNLCPLRRRSRGERAPVKLGASPTQSQGEGTEGTRLKQLDGV